jgi:hypothetical protein
MKRVCYNKRKYSPAMLSKTASLSAGLASYRFSFLVRLLIRERTKSAQEAYNFEKRLSSIIK